MKRTNTIEDDIDRIRLKIHEETKDLTDAQWVERTNKIAEAAAKRYGFKIAPSSRHKGRRTMVKGKRSDYAQWRTDLFKDMGIEKINEKAMDYQSKGFKLVPNAKHEECPMMAKEDGNEYGKKMAKRKALKRAKK